MKDIEKTIASVKQDILGKIPSNIEFRDLFNVMLYAYDCYINHNQCSCGLLLDARKISKIERIIKAAACLSIPLDISKRHKNNKINVKLLYKYCIDLLNSVAINNK